MSKVVNQPRVLERVAPPGQLWDIYGVGRCKQGGECWCYGDYRLKKVVSELKRAWGSLKKA